MRQSKLAMSPGILFFVVGPSGAGKDSLIEGARSIGEPFVFARRVITRPAGSAGEDHDELDDALIGRRTPEGLESGHELVRRAMRHRCHRDG